MKPHADAAYRKARQEGRRESWEAYQYDGLLADGVDAFNVTNLARRANATQQLVLHLLDIGCTRLGCPCTDHLQVDHRDDWVRVKVTELANLDWLCTHDHNLKTREGWQLEPGTGKRQMLPPGQQWVEPRRRPPARTRTAGGVTKSPLPTAAPARRGAGSCVP